MIVQNRVARETGGRVQVIDAKDDPDFDTDEGGRWVTWCDTHETFAQHPTRKLALWHAAGPSIWCGLCEHDLRTTTEPPSQTPYAPR